MRLKLATCQGSEIRCYGNAPTDTRALVDSAALASIVPFPIKLSLLNVRHIRDVAGRNELRIVCLSVPWALPGKIYTNLGFSLMQPLFDRREPKMNLLSCCVQADRVTIKHPRTRLTRSFSPIRYSDAPCHVLSGRLAPCWGRRTNYRRIGASRCHICITDALLYLCLVGLMDRRASDCSVLPSFLPLQRPHGLMRSLHSAFVHCMSFGTM